MSYLSGLMNNGTVICVETALHQEIQIEGGKVALHVDVTPTLVHRVLQQQQGLVAKAVEDIRNASFRFRAAFPVFVELVQNQILVSLAQEITWRFPLDSLGRVALHLCPSMAYDEERIYTAATNLIRAAERISIARTRLYISIPATWEGIQAAQRLQALNIQCNMTMVVTMAQAETCAQANVAYISPPVAAIQRWNQRNNTSPFYDRESMPWHVGINFVKRVSQFFILHEYQTQILPCDFTTVEEVTKLAGLPTVCVTPDMVRMLDETQGVVTNTMEQINGIVFHQTVHYTNKQDFEAASQAESPTGAWALVEELMGQVRTQTDWIKGAAEYGVRSDQILQGLVVPA